MAASPMGFPSITGWSRPSAPATAAGGPPAAIPFTGVNPNSTLTTAASTGSNPPPVPQAPAIPFPNNQQPLGGTNSVSTNNYVPPSTVSPFAPFPTNFPYVLYFFPRERKGDLIVQ